MTSYHELGRFLVLGKIFLLWSSFILGLFGVVFLLSKGSCLFFQFWSVTSVSFEEEKKKVRDIETRTQQGEEIMD